MHEYMTINERIKYLRKNELNFTLEKFGEHLGVGKTAISKLENGERGVTDQMFKSICREFNVNEEWLRDGTGDIFVIPEDEDAAIIESLLTERDDVVFHAILSICKSYNKLAPESKKILQDLVRDAIEHEKNREA